MSSSRPHASSYSPPRHSLVIGQRYTYGWYRMGRKGQACVLEIVGAKNSVRIRFADGERAITSAAALKTFKQDNQPRMF